MSDPAPTLPPTEGDLKALRERIEEMKKSSGADSDRIARLEARVEAAEKALEAAKRQVKEASHGLFDLGF